MPKTAQETEKEREVDPERVIISEDSVKKNMPPPSTKKQEKKNLKPS